MDESVSAIILVGGKGTRLQDLTKSTSKPYVSFFGKYRIIDFPLSSLSFSSIKNIAILTQYEPYELMKYIGSGSAWDLDIFNGGISYLTPFENRKDEVVLQRGTANALFTQIENIKKIDSKYVLILSGDQIYKIDFRNVLSFHIEKESKLTIISKDLDPKTENLSRFGIIEYDKDNRVRGFSEKPLNPKTNHISLGMYLFNRDYLLEILDKANTLLDFGSDLIPYLISRNDDIYAYKYDDIFMDLGTIDSLFKANMYFLDNTDAIKSKKDRFKVYTKQHNLPPERLYENSCCKTSVVSDGAIIKGNIKHSVISLNVYVGENSVIENSIILPSAKIGDGSKLKNVIVDEGIFIPKNSVLEFDSVTLISEKTLEERLK